LAWVVGVLAFMEGRGKWWLWMNKLKRDGACDGVGRVFDGGFLPVCLCMVGVVSWYGGRFVAV